MSAPSHPDVATHGSPIAPGVDADVKKRDPVNVEILQDLRVDDSTLYKGMDYEHLSLCECSHDRIRWRFLADPMD